MLACYNITNMYEIGDGIEKDLFKTVEYLSKACNLNHSKACYNLAVKYKNEDGVEKIH